MTGDAYQFPGGFPTDATVEAAYRAADLGRAIVGYKHFFPAVSGLAILRGSAQVGIEANRVFGTMETAPGQVGLTLNSDTPYSPLVLDLDAGPFYVDLPAGPILGAVLNADQSWVADVGIPGADQGRGGRYLVLPRGADDPGSNGVFVVRGKTRHVLFGLRAVPVGGDVEAALALLRSTRVTPVNPPADWAEPTWIDLTGLPQDTSPNVVQGAMLFWEYLRDYLTIEGTTDADAAYVAELAELGIRANEPLPTDPGVLSILADAATEADAQLRVQSLADRRDDRVAWPDRRWEWVSLRPENADFERDGELDVTARETWFYQAIATSPAMFRRRAGGGSAYWFSARDDAGRYLDGGNNYLLRVPLPVPGELFWSVTVYDARTRSQIATGQGRAALRSLFELRDQLDGDSLELRFGPTAPVDGEGRWIQTIPGAGWFVYFRIYGPGEAAFDGSWKLDDFLPQT